MSTFLTGLLAKIGIPLLKSLGKWVLKITVSEFKKYLAREKNKKVVNEGIANNDTSGIEQRTRSL